VNNFQDVVDETELIAIIEEILTHFPLPGGSSVPFPSRTVHERTPEEGNEEEDYTLVNVTRKPVHTELVYLPEEEEEDQDYSPLEPTQPPLPTIPEEKSKEEMAVQTSMELDRSLRLPLPSSTLPKEVEKPVVPQIIIQQSLPAAVPPSAPPTMEKELIELLNTIVTTQKNTMDGQQALILRLIQQQLGAENKEEEKEKKEEEPKMTPLPSPKKEIKERTPFPPEEDKGSDEASEDYGQESFVAVEEKEPEEVFHQEEKKKVNYNTSFGEFLLGGKQLFGKYSVKEKLPFQEYCLDNNNDPALRIEEPRLRRRANPLTMKLLFPSDASSPKPILNQSSEEEKQETTSNKQTEQFVMFANKLLDTVKDSRPNDHPKKESITREEITRAMEDGIALGVRQVLGYIPTEEERKAHLHQGKPYFINNLGKPTDRMTFTTREEQKLYDRNLNYLEEEWERKPSRKQPQRRNRKDPIVDSNEITRDINESKKNYSHLLSQRKEREGDEISCNSSEYNDSVSLSEEYYAFNGDPKGKQRRERKPTRRIENDDEENGETTFSILSDETEEEEKEETADFEGTGRRSNRGSGRYFTNDIGSYDSEEDENIAHEDDHGLTVTRGRMIQEEDDDKEKKQKTTLYERSIVTKSLTSLEDTTDIPRSSVLPPLKSSFLAQPETEKMIQNQRKQSNPLHHQRETTDRRTKANRREEIENESENDDEIYSLLSEEEREKNAFIHSQKSRRKSFEKRTRERYDEEEEGSNDEEEEPSFDSISTNDSPNSEDLLHRDHRKKKTNVDLEESFDPQDISVDTQSSSSPSSPAFGLVKPRSLYKESSHRTRYSLSEIRMKRKDLLSSVNLKKSKIYLPGESTEQQRKQTIGDKNGTEGEGEDKETEEKKNFASQDISVSNDSEQQRPEIGSSRYLDYNSMLSSEESSLMSERLALLRKNNKKYQRKSKKDSNSMGKEDENIPFVDLDDKSSSVHSSHSFSVQTKESDSSNSTTGRPLIYRKDQILATRTTVGTGKNGERSKVSIPLLNIDEKGYQQRKRWN
jgi:hypothetical protein